MTKFLQDIYIISMKLQHSYFLTCKPLKYFLLWFFLYSCWFFVSLTSMTYKTLSLMLCLQTFSNNIDLQLNPCNFSTRHIFIFKSIMIFFIPSRRTYSYLSFYYRIYVIFLKHAIKWFHLYKQELIFCFNVRFICPKMKL